MARYLLDTNACIRYLKNNVGVVARVRHTGVEALAVCAPVRAELWYGACKSEYPERNRERVAKFCADLICLPFDAAAAERCGELRAELARQGSAIGPYDLQIASIALVHGLILVSNNTGEFRRVPGLTVEDWQN